MTSTNRQYRLASRPVGLPKASDWTFDSAPIASPEEGQFLVENLYISLDPAMRGWLNEGRSYVPPVAIGEVMRAIAVGKVVASQHPKFPVGTHVSGLLGVQDYALSSGEGITRIDPELAPLPTYLGVLGMPGMTAYFGILEVGALQAGDTVVVSGAAGAVGSVVGQIARIKGCRVVGIAGGAQKCAWLREDLGFDAVIDYKAEDVAKSLRTHCPQGINVYFDNVGGDILEAALANLALHARVVICGAISQYNATSAVKGPGNYLSLLVNRASMTGMVVFDYADRYAEAAAAMAQWLKEGSLKAREQIVDDLETFPEALLMLFRGDNTGKLVLKVK